MINPEIEFRFESIAAQTSGDFAASWTVPPELRYFEGHFPGNPILPAVAMIDATVQLLRQALGEASLELSGVETAKFMHPVTPGLRAEIQLVKQAGSEGQNRWKASWKAGSQSLANLSLSLALRGNHR